VLRSRPQRTKDASDDCHVKHGLDDVSDDAIAKSDGVLNARRQKYRQPSSGNKAKDSHDVGCGRSEQLIPISQTNVNHPKIDEDQRKGTARFRVGKYLQHCVRTFFSYSLLFISAMSTQLEIINLSSGTSTAFKVAIASTFLSSFTSALLVTQ
jgi:hypothetical protein